MKNIGGKMPTNISEIMSVEQERAARIRQLHDNIHIYSKAIIDIMKAKEVSEFTAGGWTIRRDNIRPNEDLNIDSCVYQGLAYNAPEHMLWHIEGTLKWLLSEKCEFPFALCYGVFKTYGEKSTVTTSSNEEEPSLDESLAEVKAMYRALSSRFFGE